MYPTPSHFDEQKTALNKGSMLGKTLGGRYRILSHLGGGGYGQTYLAEDIHLPGYPRCVVKQLQPQATDAVNLQVARRLFNTEAEVLYKLGSHNQIPRLFAHFEEHQEFYLVQEFIEGSNLSQELANRRPWSEAQVVDLLQDILTTLDFVHQQHVIHRDIKPRNLIRRRQDTRIVLIDFGAVKQVSTQIFNLPEQTSSTIIIGTPGYMPREQINGNPGFYSDIYAVGMMAIQALVGFDPIRNQLPRDPQTGEIVWHNRLQNETELTRIIDRMVREDFQNRYQDVREVLNDLQNLPAASGSDSTALTLAFSPLAPNSYSSTTSTINPLPRSSRGFALQFWQIGTGLLVLGLLVWVFKQLPLMPARDHSPAPAGNPTTPIPATDQAEVLVKQGNQLREAGQAQKALAVYDKAIALQPNQLEALWGRCYVLNQLQRYEVALTTCNQALKIKPDYYKAWWSKGYALDELRRYPEALAAYDQALKLKPDFSAALSNRGAVLNSLQRYEEALAAYDKALKIEPHLAEAWNNRGAALNRLHRYDEALKSYDRALKIKPNYPEAWNNRGVVLANLRRFQAAIAAYEKALQLQPNYTPAIENRKRTLAVLGQ